MKKVVSFLIGILVLLQIWTNILKASNEQIMLFGNIEKNTMESFCIPNDDEVCQPSELFSAIKETADETGANIVRSMFLNGDNPGEYEIVKYVLFENQDSYYSTFQIAEGEMLKITDTQDETCDYFISTKKTGNPDQLGVIQSRMHHMDVTVKPLAQQFASYKADGLYYTDLPDGISISDFREKLQKNIEQKCNVVIKSEELEGSTDTTGVPYTDLSTYHILILVTALFSLLLVLYYLLQKKKDISIMQLMGIKKKHIFIKILMEPILVYPVCLLFSLFFIYAVKSDIAYVLELSGTIWIFYIFILISFCIAFSIICKTDKLIYAIRGKMYTKGIYAMNILAEILCILCLVYTGQSIYQDIIQMRTDKAIYMDWEIANDYGVFYPYYNGNDLTTREISERETVINNEFYKYVNAHGALYVNAKEYESKYTELNEISDCTLYERSIKVNPNYLNIYQILDEEGNAVQISESEKKLMVLVPSKYKEYRRQIIDFYESSHEGYRKVDEEIYGIKKQMDSAQDIGIIWIQDSQPVFCFNSNINNERGSYVENTVIQVLTENNCYISERDCILGGGNADPLKIRLDKDNRETYSQLYDTLKKLGLDDNLKTLVSVNAQIQEVITIINSRMILSFQIAALIVIVLIFLIYQSTALYFNQNKKECMVKKLYGWTWWEMYGQYCIKKLLLIIILTFLYGLLKRFKYESYLLYVSTFLMAVQASVIWCCTKYLEHKKLQDVLKGA